MAKTPGSNAGDELVFLKLGGSLITDKLTPRKPRVSVIQRISAEISSVLHEEPRLKIVLGHGSGSFGHFSGQKYHTRQGVATPEDWLGFVEVWQDAAALNRLVMDALQEAGVPALAFPPSGGAFSKGRSIQTWNLEPLRAALEHQLVPVVFGDVVFDADLGGTILSTEDLFVYLAATLKPDRILLAGLDPGVWQDYPECTSLFPVITTAEKDDLTPNISQSAAIDVTGGMADKVTQMLELISEIPSLKALIFSGAQPGNVSRALVGKATGTRLQS